MRALDDWITSYLQYTNNSEPADSFRTWVAISVIAAALRRKCCLPWGQFNIYPNMYIVLVGPSGCRKGTAMGPAMDILNSLGLRLAAEATTREALIRTLKESSDTTVNDTGSSIKFHASLTIFSQELTVFLGYNNMQLMADLCDWFDCREKWTYRTKNSGTDEITGVWVNLIGATTPDLLQTTLPRDAIGGGLTARMIMIYERGKGKSVPAPFLSTADRELKTKLVQDLERIGMQSGEFTISEPFLDMWIDWYMAQEGKPPFDDQRFSGYFERRAIHTLKLCMIVNSSRQDGNMRLDVVDLQRAIGLLRGAESRMQGVFAGVGKSKTADMVEKVMQYVGIEGEVTMSDLMKHFYYDADITTMRTVLSTLESMKVLNVVQKGKDQVIRYKEGVINEPGEKSTTIGDLGLRGDEAGDSIPDTAGEA